MDNTSWIDPVSMEAHSLQWQSPRESTKAFSEFLHGILGVGSHNVIDLGCGTGAATYYLAKKFPSSVFVGLDLSPELIRVANEIDLVKSQSNLSFQVGDMFDLAVIPNIDCVISQQTLSWLPEYEEPLRQIFTKIGPKFLMISCMKVISQLKLSFPKMSRKERFFIILIQYLKLRDFQRDTGTKF